MTHLMIPPKAAGESGRQYAYRVLYQAIMTLQLPPSWVLSDSELSQALQISRTPIREAIVSLQEAKLVEVFPQKASIVSRIDLDAIEEGVFLRYHTECGIFREAVRKADGAAVGRLRANLLEQERRLQRGDVVGYFEMDNAFHKELYMIAGKPWVWATVARIVTHHDRVRLLHAQLGTDQLWPAHREHWEILEAIMSRSEKDMDEFFHEHLTAGYRSALPELIRRFPDYFVL